MVRDGQNCQTFPRNSTHYCKHIKEYLKGKTKKTEYFKYSEEGKNKPENQKIIGELLGEDTAIKNGVLEYNDNNYYSISLSDIYPMGKNFILGDNFNVEKKPPIETYYEYIKNENDYKWEKMKWDKDEEKKDIRMINFYFSNIGNTNKISKPEWINIYQTKKRKIFEKKNK